MLLTSCAIGKLKGVTVLAEDWSGSMRRLTVEDREVDLYLYVVILLWTDLIVVCDWLRFNTIKKTLVVFRIKTLLTSIRAFGNSIFVVG